MHEASHATPVAMPITVPCNSPLAIQHLSSHSHAHGRQPIMSALLQAKTCLAMPSLTLCATLRVGALAALAAAASVHCHPASSHPLTQRVDLSLAAQQERRHPQLAGLQCHVQGRPALQVLGVDAVPVPHKLHDALHGRKVGAEGFVRRGEGAVRDV